MTTVKQPGRRSAPTLEAVAAAAGVSRSTVSRVVNGSSQVSEDVLAAVQDAIKLLNYVPNRAARSLANSQTMAIALVVPEDTSRFFGDPYFSSVVQGIANGIEDSDYVLNLQLAHPSRPSPKTTRYLLGGNVDGAFVISHHVGDDFLTTLSASLPVVFGGRPLDEKATQSYYVDVDNVTAAAKGVQRLIDIGRTRIGMIAGPPDMPAGIDRTAGWTKALTDAGLPADRIANGDFSLMSGARGMRELLDAHPDIDGVFIASDLMAAGALGVLAERRVAVPADVAVVGFDDSPAAVAGPIQLTTVHQPSLEMGEKMAEVMLSLLRGETVDHVHLMDTRLVIRDSA